MKLKNIFLNRMCRLAAITGLLFIIQCGSGSNYIKRNTPDSNFAKAHTGDVVYSATDTKFDNDRQRVVYKYWKFVKSDSKSITLIYEEHMDFLKIKPDFGEEKVYSIDKDYHVKIHGMILDIYELGSKSIVYYIKSGE